MPQKTKSLKTERCQRFPQNIFPKESYHKKWHGSFKEKTVLPTYSPGIPRFKKEWKKRSYSANITFRPKGIVASTDANFSYWKRPWFRWWEIVFHNGTKREHVSICLPKQLVEASFCSLWKWAAPFRCKI